MNELSLYELADELTEQIKEAFHKYTTEHDLPEAIIKRKTPYFCTITLQGVCKDYTVKVAGVEFKDFMESELYLFDFVKGFYLLGYREEITKFFEKVNRETAVKRFMYCRLIKI